MRQPEPIAADIPPDLAPVDDLLTRFGKWSISKYVRQRCASAEGAYSARRYPESVPSRDLSLTNQQGMTVQRALAAIDGRLRDVLVILYVPRRLMNGARQRPEVMLRLLRVPPRVAVHRHLEGLRAIAPLLGDLLPQSENVAILQPPDTASAMEFRHSAGFAIQEQNADD